MRLLLTALAVAGALAAGSAIAGDYGCEQPCACETGCGCEAVCGCENACGYDSACGGCDTCGCYDCCDCRPVWSVRAGALYLRRDDPDPEPLVVVDFNDNFTANQNGEIVLLDASDFNFDYETGWDVSVARDGPSGWGWEARYFEVDDWSDSRSAFTNVIGYEIPYAVEEYFTDSITPTIVGTYESELRSAELNARYQAREWLTLLAGFRYLELDEQLDITGIFTSPLTADNLITADNQLAGFQVGAEARLWSRGALSLEGIIKTGIYNNDASNSALVRTWYATRFSEASDNETAYVTEVALNGVYAVSDRVALLAGYQLLWIEGVALAPDQIPVSAPYIAEASIDIGGDVFYHGANLGVEFRY